MAILPLFGPDLQIILALLGTWFEHQNATAKREIIHVPFFYIFTGRTCQCLILSFYLCVCVSSIFCFGDHLTMFGYGDYLNAHCTLHNHTIQLQKRRRLTIKYPLNKHGCTTDSG